MSILEGLRRQQAATPIAKPLQPGFLTPPPPQPQLHHPEMTVEMLQPSTKKISLSAKETEQEMDALSRTNFNLKLRVYHLEEALRQAQAGVPQDTLKQNIDQQMQLSQLKEELEQKNKLLLKARTTIETMQVDLDLARTGQNIKRSLATDDVVIEANKQAEHYRKQLASVTAQLRELERQRSQSQGTATQYRDLQQQLSHVTSQLSASEAERSKLESQLSVANSDKREAETQLQQCKLHMQKLSDEASKFQLKLELSAAETAHLSDRLADREKQLSEASATIHRLEQQHEKISDSASNQQSMLLSRLEESEKALTATESELRATTQQVDQLTRQLRDAESTINRMHKEAEYAMQTERESHSQRLHESSREATETRKHMEQQLNKITLEHADLKRVLGEREKESIARIEERNQLLATVAARLRDIFPEQMQQKNPEVKFEVFADQMVRTATLVGRLKASFESQVASTEQYWTSQMDNFSERLNLRMRDVEALENSIKLLRKEVEDTRRENTQLKRGTLTTDSELEAVRRERDEMALKAEDLAEVVQTLRDKFAQMEEVGSRASDTFNKLNESQQRIDRLTENNRLLILELQDKKQELERVNKHYRSLQREHARLLNDVESLRKQVLSGASTKHAESKEQVLGDAVESIRQTQRLFAKQREQVQRQESALRTQSAADVMNGDASASDVSRRSGARHRLASLQQEVRAQLDQVSQFTH